MSESRKTAAQNNATTPRVPAWVWLFTGVVTGLFIAFLYYLTSVPVPVSTPDDRSAVTPSATPAPTPRPKTYDFYDKLPNSSLRTSPKPTAAPRKPTQPDSSKPLLVIQTGSFQQANDAQRRRAELLLLGFEVHITETTIPGSGTWHRVQIGPYQSGPALDSALQTLTENRIDHLVIELK